MCACRLRALRCNWPIMVSFTTTPLRTGWILDCRFRPLCHLWVRIYCVLAHANTQYTTQKHALFWITRAPKHSSSMVLFIIVFEHHGTYACITQQECVLGVDRGFSTAIHHRLIKSKYVSNISKVCLYITVQHCIQRCTALKVCAL